MVHWQLFLKTIFQDGKTVIKKKKEKKKVTLQDLSQKNAWKVTIA